MMDTKIIGKVFKCGDKITVYQIIPQRYWKMSRPEPDVENLGRHLFEGLDAADAPGVPFHNEEIVVAGRDFGCGGKSILHPVIAMKSAGVKLVIAESVSRYCYRNAVNLALPVLLCQGITAFVCTGESITVDVLSGSIRRADGAELHCTGLSPFAVSLIESGGELAYYCGK